jgi:hypothetical protein
MKNVVEFIQGLCTPVYIDLDAVTAIEKTQDPEKVTILIPFRRYDNISPMRNPDQTGEEAVEAVISRWRHGHGRPEIIEAFSDSEGPQDGYGRELVDLSMCATFSASISPMYGPMFNCRMIDNNGQSRVYFVKRDMSMTDAGQCAALESLWRKARGEV